MMAGADLRDGSSMVEQRPFKPLVAGSSPARPMVTASVRGRSTLGVRESSWPRRASLPPCSPLRFPRLIALGALLVADRMRSIWRQSLSPEKQTASHSRGHLCLLGWLTGVEPANLWNHNPAL